MIVEHVIILFRIVPMSLLYGTVYRTDTELMN